MDIPYYNCTNPIKPSEYDRGFRKTPLNITFGDISAQDVNANQNTKISAYTYHPIDTNFTSKTQTYMPGGEVHIKSPKSLTSFAKINFSQRASSSCEPRLSYQTQQSERAKSKHSDINVHNNVYEPLIPEMEVPKVTGEMQSSQAFFSKYANSQHNGLDRAKSNSQFVVPKQPTCSYNIHSNLADEVKSSQKQAQYQRARDLTSNQVQQYKKKIGSLQREVTQSSLQKGELIIKVAELQRQNSDLKRQLRNITQNSSFSSAFASTSGQGKKIEIDEDLFYQIQSISLQQKEINKIKQEYIKLAAAGYQNQIKKLTHQNNTLSLEIQSLRVELEMAKQDLVEKQNKIQFLQRETRNLQQKSLTSSRMSVESSSQRSTEVITLRHTLNALESKYKTVTKQLANKQAYILKYITGRRSSEDLQAIKYLVSQNQPIFSSPQLNPSTLDNSKQQ